MSDSSGGRVVGWPQRTRSVGRLELLVIEAAIAELPEHLWGDAAHDVFVILLVEFSLIHLGISLIKIGEFILAVKSSHWNALLAHVVGIDFEGEVIFGDRVERTLREILVVWDLLFTRLGLLLTDFGLERRKG